MEMNLFDLIALVAFAVSAGLASHYYAMTEKLSAKIDRLEFGCMLVAMGKAEFHPIPNGVAIKLVDPTEDATKDAEKSSC